MSKFIVTGGAGFIGSNLVDRLLDDEHEVTVIDNFSAGKRENLPKAQPKLKIVVADFSSWTDCYPTCAEHFENTEGVFHLAADARIQPSIENPEHTVHHNVIGTMNVLELLRRCSTNAPIVYSASSSCYGRNQPPFHEDMATDCLNPYSVSKYAGERLCKTWGHLYAIRNVSLRYFNVFGQRSPLHLGGYSPVIGLFFKQALHNQPLTIVGDGYQTRDFTHVDDVVLANILSMDDLQKKHMCNGSLLNVGTGQSCDILSLAHMIINVCKSSSQIHHLPARPGEARETRANISRIRDLFPVYDPAPLHSHLQFMRMHYEKLFSKDANADRTSM